MKFNEISEEDMDNIELGELISNVNRYCSKFVDDKLAEYNITLSQARFLLILNKQDHISQEELCGMLDMTEGTVARTIKRLEDKNFVKREVNPEDKRKKVIILTEDGENTIKNVAEKNFELKTKLESKISPEELREFKYTLINIVNTLLE